MPINWVKVSEIFFDALLTGVISAITVWIAYKLGKLQADTNWERENKRRRKEIKDQDLKELIKKQIAILHELLDYRGMLLYKVSQDFYNNSNIILDGNEIHRLSTTIFNTEVLFQNDENSELRLALRNIKEILAWNIEGPNTEEDGRRRQLFVIENFHVFSNILTDLEKKLIPI